MPQKPKPLDDSESMAHWFGKDLRNWRRVRGMSASALGEKVHLSGSSIEKIEKGDRSCNSVLAQQLDDTLDAGGALIRLWRRVEEDADKQRAEADNSSAAASVDGTGEQAAGMLGLDQLSFLNRSLTPVERRALLAAGGLAALNPASFADLIPQIVQTQLPSVVRPEDIEQVRVAAKTHAGWDNLYGGGGIVRASSIGQFIWAKSLLDIRCPPDHEADLFTAVGHLATVMGASAFDAYEHGDATRLLEFGTWCAERADNWHLRARALSWRARHAIWCGSPDMGLTHADNGLVRADRLTPREQSVLHNARARAWAKMRNRQETLAAIGRSDEVFGRAKDGEDAAWMAYYDHAQHHGDTGHAAFDITLLADQPPKLAIARLQTAINGHTDAFVRSRAMSGTKLATLTMAIGDPQEAVSIAHRALNEVGQLRSKRAVTDVQDLARASTKYARRPGVAELRERIRATVQV
ncbi:helix-turn-helix transcriptional regulator [Streptomyces geranii]|uniref:helix-turn-helix transcriptional regulator n=1 Tax=Streptomyces geranii TaxID=2058923 RepID=UPI000D029652|nr:helix-turn-helix transcriptional regulator [Streptomyces geranii]